MNSRVLYHIARADFLERVRRYSFLVTLAFTLYIAFEANRGNIVANLGKYRGVYNSAWLGMLLSLTATSLISLAGFYIIKNTVERDRHTGVGQILAATPLGRVSYLCGKALSNLAVLGVIAIILLCAAFAMQLWRAEAAGVNPWKLVAPFVFLTFPALAFLAALAVLFECVPVLRGGFGNVFYFFFWAALLSVGIAAHTGYLDLVGVGFIESSLRRAAQQLPDYTGGFTFQIGPHAGQTYQTFVWEGFHWPAGVVISRLAWLLFSFLVLLLAAAFFDRFDPSRGIFHRFSASLAGGSAPPSEVQEETPDGGLPAEPPGELPATAGTHLTPLAATAVGGRFGAVLVAELLLMLKGRSRWWWLVALGLLIGTFAAPAGEPRGKVLAFAWLWPVLIWSAMGTREARNGTGPLIFSSARALERQLPAVWLAGVAVALATSAGAGVRWLVSADWVHLAAWVAGAMFIPALALALGVWSGTSKLFEGLYTALWYAGPLQPTPALDFMGASRRLSAQIPACYLAATLLLLAAAAIGRRRQIRA
jgi:hypothetical protein